MTQQTRQPHVPRGATTGQTLRISGLVLLAVGIFWMILGRLAKIDAPFLILNWHIGAILLGLFLIYRGKQYVARSLPAEILDDTRPPVVYLRPFRKDASTVARVLPGLANPAVLLATFSTFEEQLAEALRPIGPLVALANPRHALPEPGAARFHVRDDEWKDSVTQLLHESTLVILRPGHTDSMLWETETAFNVLRPGGLLLLFHNTNKKEYNAIAQSLKQSIGVSLPEFGGRNVFVAFGNDWKPYLLQLKAPYFRRSQYKPWKRLVNHALEPVFRGLGVEWAPSPVSALTIFALVMLAIVLLFILSLVLTT